MIIFTLMYDVFYNVHLKKLKVGQFALKGRKRQQF